MVETKEEIMKNDMETFKRISQNEEKIDLGRIAKAIERIANYLESDPNYIKSVKKGGSGFRIKGKAPHQ